MTSFKNVGRATLASFLTVLSSFAFSSGGYALESRDLDTMIGQMLMIGFRGMEIREGDSIVRDIRQLGLGGVILFDRDVALKSDERNIQSPEQLLRLTTDLQNLSSTKLFVAVDQEGGKVRRLKPERGFPDTYSAAWLGEVDDPAFTFQAAADIGRTLHDLGINVDFAPVVDVNTNPDNPVIGKLERSFSSDPEKVALHGGAFVRGLHDWRVLSCLKHFPGHGSSASDSHLGFTDITDTWSPIELWPYHALVSAGEADMIMTGHLFNANIDPFYPATLSFNALTGVLREQLGFDGVIVSDDMQMGAITEHYGMEEAVRRSVTAGADILLFGNNLVYDPDVAVKAAGIVRSMVEDGTIGEDRVARSYRRIMTLKHRWDEEPPGPGITVNGRAGSVEVASGWPVTLRVEFGAGEWEGTIMNWWLLARDEQAGQWYCPGRDARWIAVDDELNGCAPVHAGPLFDLPSTVLVENAVLPRGNYAFTFGVGLPGASMTSASDLDMRSSVQVAIR